MIEFETRQFNVIFTEAESFDCSMASDDDFHVDFGEAVPKEYAGSYTITPAAEAQTLATANRLLSRDIVVEAIPSNYGLITYNGSIITVS